MINSSSRSALGLGRGDWTHGKSQRLQGPGTHPGGPWVPMASHRGTLRVSPWFHHFFQGLAPGSHGIQWGASANIYWELGFLLSTIGFSRTCSSKAIQWHMEKYGEKIMGKWWMSSGFHGEIHPFFLGGCNRKIPLGWWIHRDDGNTSYWLTDVGTTTRPKNSGHEPPWVSRNCIILFMALYIYIYEFRWSPDLNN